MTKEHFRNALPTEARAPRGTLTARNLLFFSLVFLLGSLPISAQLNQNAPSWSAYSSGNFYHRDFSVSGYSTTTYPYALALQDPVNVSYTFPAYTEPGNGFYEYSQGSNFTDSLDSTQRCTIPPGDADESPPTANRYWFIGGHSNSGVSIARGPQSAHVSDLQGGLKGFTFQGDFSGTATGSGTSALAVIFYHQSACYAGHFEYGFAYNFVPQYYPGTDTLMSPFSFYWSQETNCGTGNCYMDYDAYIPVTERSGSTNDYTDSSFDLRYTPLPDLRTTANSVSTYLWGVSAYFDYSSGSNFRVQIYDPYDYSVLYDHVISPVITNYASASPYSTTTFATDEVSGGAAGSPSYAVNGISGYVTAGLSLAGSPTAGSPAPEFDLSFIDAGK